MLKILAFAASTMATIQTATADDMETCQVLLDRLEGAVIEAVDINDVSVKEANPLDGSLQKAWKVETAGGEKFYYFASSYECQGVKVK